MNKKKKITRIKHRKNKDRIKKLLQTSLLKAKPKQVILTPKIEVPVETEVNAATEPIIKKTPEKKKATKRTTTKKAPAKKKTTKKITTKKAPAKKKTTKKD